MDFEVKLKKLETIVSQMESGELSLDKSLNLFEEGVKLSKECNAELNEAEQKVKVLLSVSDSGEAKTEEFGKV